MPQQSCLKKKTNKNQIWLVWSALSTASFKIKLQVQLTLEQHRWTVRVDSVINRLFPQIYSQPFMSLGLTSADSTVFSIHGWKFTDVEGWLYALFYAILYKGLFKGSSQFILGKRSHQLSISWPQASCPYRVSIALSLTCLLWRRTVYFIIAILGYTI